MLVESCAKLQSAVSPRSVLAVWSAPAPDTERGRNTTTAKKTTRNAVATASLTPRVR